MEVLDLLRSIQLFFRELKIEDEGEYWETRNRTILEAHMVRTREVIKEELRKNPTAKMKVKTPTGKIIDLVT